MAWYMWLIYGYCAIVAANIIFFGALVLMALIEDRRDGR